MNTFIEHFEYFKKELSYEKLFLKGMTSEHRKNIERKTTLILIIFSVIITLLVINYWNDKIYCIFLLPVSYLSYLYYDVRRSRKHLSKDGLPIPKEFYKWKSKELEVLRLKEVYKIYDKTDSPTISQLIEIGKNKLNNGFNDPFIVFEKVAGYFCSSFFSFLIGFFMATIKDDLVKNFEFYLKFFIGLFIFQIYIVGSYYFIKRGHLLDKQSEKEYLQDYIFVFQNILLMKEYEKQ
jgi:hypothetical protein